jgi:lipid-A-disaccharide synthase
LDECPEAVIKDQVALEIGVAQGRSPVVGLLPGSRKEEIRNLLPVMVDAAKIMKNHYPEVQCVLPLAPGIDQSFVQPFIDNSDVMINLFRGNIYELLSLCDVAMVTSGTATLETGIMGVPMVIVYRASTVSYWIGRMVIKVSYIGLVNLIAEEEVVPELIQAEVTAERLAGEARIILDNAEIRENIKKKLDLVREKLGKGGASEKTARIAVEMMK